MNTYKSVHSTREGIVFFDIGRGHFIAVEINVSVFSTLIIYFTVCYLDIHVGRECKEQIKSLECLLKYICQTIITRILRCDYIQISATCCALCTVRELPHESASVAECVFVPPAG